MLPALTRIAPRLSVIAARCCVVLQLLAITFHTSRGEFSVLPLNALLLALAACVAWGRDRRVPVPALHGAAARRRITSVALWTAQCALAAVFGAAGLAKLTQPMAALAQTMPWTAAVAPAFVRCIGMVDLAGAVGVLLPSLTRVLPRTAVVAALGCTVLQAAAIVLHASRGEWNVLPLNALLIALALLVAWGRGRALPVQPLHGDAARHRVQAVLLWTAQAIAAAIFIGAGMWKLSAPIAELTAAMRWPGDVPPALVRLIGAIDIAGGLGLLLPSLTRILPWLTPLAALGCSVLQLCAIAFHVHRGELSVLPLNALLLACSLAVLWGRMRLAPVAPRV